MNFHRHYIGRFFGVLIFIAGYLKSNCLATSEQVREGTRVLCEEVDESNSNSTTTYFISLVDSNGDVECNDILYGGKYTKHQNGEYSYVIYKPEVIGFICTISDYIQDDCDDTISVQANEFGIECKSSTELVRASKFDAIPQSPEDLPVGRLSWKKTSRIHFIECKQAWLFSEGIESIIFRRIRLDKSIFSTVPVCDDLVVEPFQKYMSVDAADSIEPELTKRLFTHRNKTGYNCLDEEASVEENGNTRDPITKMITLYCEEIDTHPDLKSEIVSCDFTNFRKNIDGQFEYSGSTQQAFIYIDENERPKSTCSNIIKRGTVKNYGNNILEFTIYKAKVSGYECEFSDPILVKEHLDSYTMMTKFTGLICNVPFDLTKDLTFKVRETPKLLQCNFITLVGDGACKKKNENSRDMLWVTTNKDLQCSSIIVDGKVNAKDYDIVYFRIYKPELSGYICDLKLNEIKDVRQDWLFVKLRNRMLNCKKYKKITTLTCSVDGIHVDHTTLKSSIKIHVETTKKVVLCTNILSFAVANLTGSTADKYVTVSIGISSANKIGFECKMDNQTKYTLLEDTRYEFEMNINNELNCYDFVPQPSELVDWMNPYFATRAFIPWKSKTEMALKPPPAPIRPQENDILDLLLSPR